MFSVQNVDCYTTCRNSMKSQHLKGPLINLAEVKGRHFDGNHNPHDNQSHANTDSDLGTLAKSCPAYLLHFGVLDLGGLPGFVAHFEKCIIDLADTPDHLTSVLKLDSDSCLLADAAFLNSGFDG